MLISRVILFAYKNWKIASRYGFASGVFQNSNLLILGLNTGKRTGLFWHKIVFFVQHTLTHSVACCTDGVFLTLGNSAKRISSAHQNWALIFIPRQRFHCVKYLETILTNSVYKKRVSLPYQVNPTQYLIQLKECVLF